MFIAMLAVTAALATETGEPVTGDPVYGECPVDDAPVCLPVAEELAPTEYLRALSLDLRGNVPSIEEYETVRSRGEVPEAWIDDWLDSPAFAAQVVRRHRSLLWNNLLGSKDEIADLAVRDNVYYRRTPSPGPYPGRTREVPWCANKPATASDVNGWVTVTPFWAPDTTVKVCASEAQTAEYSPAGKRCASPEGTYEAACGCGPGLRWCMPPGWRDKVLGSFATDVEKRIEDMTLRNASYLEVFRGRTMYVNGPMSFYLHHQAWQGTQISQREFSPDIEDIPELDPLAENTWVPVALGPEHAGVLTSPAYLGRFTSQRSRAKRFYEAFLCQPFQAPAGGIAITSSTTLDLQERDGCDYCHRALEPAAAAWGRWIPFGMGYLSPSEYPAYSDTCYECALSNAARCSRECVTNYLVDPISNEQNPYIGWLSAYQFLHERDIPNIDAGPAVLVNAAVADGRIAACSARTAASGLLGRDLTTDDADWLDALAWDFASSGWKYRELVKAIVTSDEYRRPR